MFTSTSVRAATSLCAQNPAIAVSSAPMVRFGVRRGSSRLAPPNAPKAGGPVNIDELTGRELATVVAKHLFGRKELLTARAQRVRWILPRAGWTIPEPLLP